MRAFVFTDRALERQAGRFVWLSINAEKAQNADFLEKHPIVGYPTLLVIDPDKEEAVFRWVGGATVSQLQELLDDGERAARGAGSGPDAVLAEADRLLGGGKGPEAAAKYREALAAAPADWPERDRAVESLLSVLSGTGERAECVALARAELPKERNLHFAVVATAGLDCALGLEDAARAEALPQFEAAARDAALGEPRIEMPADDRSSILAMLVGALQEAKDTEGAKKLAEEWLAFLEAEAARAPSPEARAVFDPHTLSAAIAAGVPTRAIPPLERSAKDFPEDYNPPARLAVAFREAGRLDDALFAAERALSLAYGPRKLQVYSTKADVLERKGDKAAARSTLEEALRYAEGLPKAQVSLKRIEAIKKRIEGLTG